jgi:Arc/MetJ-type ribon-helix-helix transcriptional regulator
MEVRLTPDQEAFIRQAIASGRDRTPEDAVLDAMARWEESERARIELCAALDEAEGELATAQYSDWSEETLPQLSAELKREGRARRDRERIR